MKKSHPKTERFRRRRVAQSGQHKNVYTVRFSPANLQRETLLVSSSSLALATKSFQNKSS